MLWQAPSVCTDCPPYAPTHPTCNQLFPRRSLLRKLPSMSHKVQPHHHTMYIHLNQCVILTAGRCCASTPSSPTCALRCAPRCGRRACRCGSGAWVRAGGSHCRQQRLCLDFLGELGGLLLLAEEAEQGHVTGLSILSSHSLLLLQRSITGGGRGGVGARERPTLPRPHLARQGAALAAQAGGGAGSLFGHPRMSRRILFAHYERHCNLHASADRIGNAEFVEPTPDGRARRRLVQHCMRSPTARPHGCSLNKLHGSHSCRLLCKSPAPALLGGGDATVAAACSRGGGS